MRGFKHRSTFLRRRFAPRGLLIFVRGGKLPLFELRWESLHPFWDFDLVADVCRANQNCRNQTASPARYARDKCEFLQKIVLPILWLHACSIQALRTAFQPFLIWSKLSW